jgi:phospholipase C
MPEVSFLKAGHSQDGHAGYSDPIDEQKWIVDEVNAIQASADWDSTAIIVAYDDSDGWYDHQASTIVRKSATPQDALNGAGQCNANNGDAPPATTGNDRCGFGPRLPLLVISPYAKVNYVDHTLTDQSSILKFIEDNWSLAPIGGDSADASAGTIANMFDFAGGTRAGKLTLDHTTGNPPAGSPPSTPPPATPPPATPPPTTVSPASIGKVKCKGKLKKHATKVTLTCTTQHATTAATSLRLRLYKGKKQLATASGKLAVKKKKLSITLKSKKLKSGKYTLKVSIATVGLAARSQSLTIKI